jgi:hypothetical protein
MGNIISDMGNIISDIETNDHIISNIRNIQRKYELRGIIEAYFASIIKSNSWDRFICKCSKQINSEWEPPIAQLGTFKLMCEIAVKKTGLSLSNIIGLGDDKFTEYMNNIKPINRPYPLDSVMILLDFPIGFNTLAHISKVPIDKLIALREIYNYNINLLQIDQFKYDSNTSDIDILQNVVNISSTSDKITYPLVSDALQLSYRVGVLI